MNSEVLNFYFLRTAAPFRGGFFSANRQFIEQLPIPDITDEQQFLVSQLVDYVTWLNDKADTGTFLRQEKRESQHLGYYEQIINGLVYELFFPEELHAAGLHLFQLLQQANLPTPESIPAAQRLETLRLLFDRLYDLNHPLRRALFDLRSLEFVRIIEGEA